MKKLCALAGAFLLLSVAAFGQTYGTKYENIVLDKSGHPIGNATILVCTNEADGTPCAPTATIFSDRLMTMPITQPLRTDGYGNYKFYAPSALYELQITSQIGQFSTPTITTYRDVLLPCDPANGCANVGGGGGGGGGSLLLLNAIGTQDGTNLIFTLSATGTGYIGFSNTALLSTPGDYSISGNILTFVAGEAPHPLDHITFYAVSGASPVQHSLTPAPDGTNAVFTMPSTPTGGVVMMFVNNGFDGPADYTIVGNQITFHFIPAPTDSLVAFY